MKPRPDPDPVWLVMVFGHGVEPMRHDRDTWHPPAATLGEPRSRSWVSRAVRRFGRLARDEDRQEALVGHCGLCVVVEDAPGGVVLACPKAGRNCLKRPQRQASNPDCAVRTHRLHAVERCGCESMSTSRARRTHRRVGPFVMPAFPVPSTVERPAKAPAATYRHTAFGALGACRTVLSR